MKVSSCSPPHEVGSPAGPTQTVWVLAGEVSLEVLPGSGRVAERGVARVPISVQSPATPFTTGAR